VTSNAYYNDGYAVVQLAWLHDWETTNWDPVVVNQYNILTQLACQQRFCIMCDSIRTLKFNRLCITAEECAPRAQVLAQQH
jgi:hypothetical protein